MNSLLHRIDVAVISISRMELHGLADDSAWDGMDPWVHPWFEAERLQSAGEYAAAASLFREVLHAYATIPDAVVRATSGLASMLLLQDATQDAAEVLATVDVDSVEHVGYRGRLLRLQALVDSAQGRYAEAAEQGERASACLATGPYYAALGNALTELATCYHRLGRLPDAIRAQYRANDAFVGTGKPLAKAISLVNLGVIHGEAGNAEGARRYFSEARGIPLDADGDRIRLWCALNLGLLNIERDNGRDAIPDLLQAYDLGEKMQMWSTVTGACRGLAAAHRLLGDVPQAKLWMERAHTYYERAPSEALRHTNLIEDARIHCLTGEYEQALAIAVPLVEDARQRKDFSSLVRLLAVVSETNAAARNHEAAYVALAERTQLQATISDDSIHQQLTLLRVEQDMKAERESAARERALLHALMPESIAARVITGEEHIADEHHGVSILFADIVGFTAMSQNMEPRALLRLINTIFTLFDEVVSRHQLVRIKTIGDAYMAIANPSSTEESSALRAAHCSRELMQMMKATFPQLSIRIGLHVGTVVAGVIGKERPLFDVWGDAVNVAARMEQLGEQDRIHCTAAFANTIRTSSVDASRRGLLDVKGKGLMETWWIKW